MEQVNNQAEPEAVADAQGMWHNFLTLMKYSLGLVVAVLLFLLFFVY